MEVPLGKRDLHGHYAIDITDGILNPDQPHEV